MRYAHGHHESVLDAHRTRTAANSAAYLIDTVDLTGCALLDVGSGAATITCDLAEIAGPVTAIEPVAGALAAGRTEAARRGTTIEFVQASVFDLPFDDGSFDVVHAHQVLQHLSDPVAALREMARVCRPDGWVAVRDADYAGFTWFPQLDGLDDWMRLYQQVARVVGGEPDAGRRLLSWAQSAGLRDIAAMASVWCFAEPGARRRWGRSWARRAVESDFATHALDSGLATSDDLAAIRRAWLDWSDCEDGWLTIPHGEILARPAGA